MNSAKTALDYLYAGNVGEAAQELLKMTGYHGGVDAWLEEKRKQEKPGVCFQQQVHIYAELADGSRTVLCTFSSSEDHIRGWAEKKRDYLKLLGVVRLHLSSAGEAFGGLLTQC